jgi:mono/diheme cytochrome c family protein
MRLICAQILIGLTLALLTGCQCSHSNDQASNNKASGTASEAAARGKVVYQSNCIACHNANPKLPGSLGPEVNGASKELLAARILHGNYPEGYQPKRSSHIMQALPHLNGDIDALAAFLNQP